jgi:hypothetical protein
MLNIQQGIPCRFRVSYLWALCGVLRPNRQLQRQPLGIREKKLSTLFEWLTDVLNRINETRESVVRRRLTVL